MKKYFFILLFFLTQNFYSQDKYYYHIVFSEDIYIPQIFENDDFTKKLIFKNKNINLMFDKLKVYHFQAYYKYAIGKQLKNTYEIICNGEEIIFELKNKFPEVFQNIREYIPNENQYLFTPDDYGILPPYGSISAFPSYFDVIRAEEAWDITNGSPSIILGVNESPIRYTHEDLLNKTVNLLDYSPSTQYSFSRRHATGVGGIMAGITNNSIGLPSIGYNCKLTQGNSFTTLHEFGAKVVNMSRGTPTFIPTEQDAINEMTENDGVVFVAASGNGVLGNVSVGYLNSNGLAINAENFSNIKHYPASCKNVISVSTVGDTNIPYTTTDLFDNWIDMHKFKTPIGTKYAGSQILVTEQEITHQHNDSVDIVVPGYRIPHLNGDSDNGYGSGVFGTGTSYSTPIVSGAIGLMFSVNNCLKPKEVESILKLTAVNIENFPENIEYHGKLGGGRLDAFKAVEMANEMYKQYGTVVVEDRILYRNWFYKLETSPYEIKMLNNLVTEEAKIKFFARDNIEILSGDYNPEIGYIDLQVNTNLPVGCNSSSPFKSSLNIINSHNRNYENFIKLFPNPNKGTFTINIDEKEVKDLKIEIFDLFGKLVYETITNSTITEIDKVNLPNGMYIVKLSSNNINEVLKFLKE